MQNTITVITLLNRHKIVISETVKVDDGLLCEMIVSLQPRRVGHTRERQDWQNRPNDWRRRAELASATGAI